MLKFAKKLKFLFFCLVLAGFFPQGALAAENRFVTLVNPVRGAEFFEETKIDPFFGLNLQKNLHEQFNLPATWLLRFDALDSEKIKAEIKRLPDSHEKGIFLEVTPQMAQVANVRYPGGGVFWHDANKVFLSGYLPKDRKKLIDTVFWKFKNVFGNYPRSVGAWWVDAYSAQYLREKYGVTGILLCADQFGTDGYQIWGGWWGVPYFPSKYNLLMPAQTVKNKLDLTVFWWAARDPEQGYGASVRESTFSVQANDYGIHHQKDVSYFKELLAVYLNNEKNQFGQLTVGLENDNDWQKIGDSYEKQLLAVAEGQRRGEFKVTTMGEFADWYRQKFRGLSPAHQVGHWLMSPDFRVSLVEKDGQQFIRDLRIYNETWPEANLLTANPWRTLAVNNPYKIDSLRLPEQLKKAPSEINLPKLVKEFGRQKIPFKQNYFWLFSFYLVLLGGLIFFLRKNWKLLALVTIGSLCLSLTMVKSGLVYPFGMGFWGPNGHDGIWHLTLINELSRFSWQNPVFAGAPLANYHFGFDLLLALLQRVTFISPGRLYFQVLPPLLAIALGILTYQLVKRWTDSERAAWWSTFLVYFGGSFGWLLGKGESVFWANQAISTLINPPFALSLVILLWGLLKLLDFQENPTRKNLIFCALLFGILWMVKVYAGVITLAGLFGWSLTSGLFNRSEFKKSLSLSALSLAVALAVFLPFNTKASSLLVFSPLWLPRTMIAFSDRVGWVRLASARGNYLAAGIWLKWLLAEALAILIFILGNLGTRIVGFWEWLRLKKATKLTALEVFIFSALFTGFIIPLLFVQKGNPWNTIQFFYYFQFLMAILGGVALGKIGSQKRNYLWLALLILMTLPTTFITLKDNYLPARPPARVSMEELEALKFLGAQPRGVVLSVPFDQYWREIFLEPRPLYAYETTGYITALSRQPSFLADEMNLEISAYPWRERREKASRFFATDNASFANDFLRQNEIKYLYLVKGQDLRLNPEEIKAEKIFENGEVKVYQVKL
jgi:hypothetical protein